MARILLVEDDDGVRAFVSKALSFSGHDVMTAEDGGLAEEVLEQEAGRFDLMLSDIRMPVLDGIGLAISAKQRFPALTVMLMTGFAEQRERAGNLSAIVYDVIPKPFTLAELIAKVEAALAGTPAEIVPLSRRSS
jgi:two-component system cell cycle response regulator CpdR